MTPVGKENIRLAMRETLKGIDQIEQESPVGWWPTSVGAEFGAEKLVEVLQILDVALEGALNMFSEQQHTTESITPGFAVVHDVTPARRWTVYKSALANDLVCYEIDSPQAHAGETIAARVYGRERMLKITPELEAEIRADVEHQKRKRE